VHSCDKLTRANHVHQHFPHAHVCGSHALQPSLWATATRTASSDSLRPAEAMGAACNQSPECVAVAESNLALSTSLDVLERSWSMCFTATGLSHAFWMCLASLVGTEVPERLVQMFSTKITDWSVKSLMPSGRMDCCSSNGRLSVCAEHTAGTRWLIADVNGRSSTCSTQTDILEPVHGGT